MDETQSQTNQTLSTKPITDKKLSTKSPLFLMSFGAGVIVLLVIVLWTTGFVYLGVKKPGQKVTAQVHVCTDADIAAYNSALGFDSDAGAAKAEQTLTSLGKSIKTRNDSGRDATCQYILWHYAAFVGDKAAQKVYLDNLVRLNTKGSYVNGNIKSFEGIETLQTLTSEQKSTEEQGQG